MTLKEQIGSSLVKQVDLKRNKILKVKQIENFEEAIIDNVEALIDVNLRKKEQEMLDKKNAKTCNIFWKERHSLL